MLPNFLIIGAQKSGTSSLAHYLDLHPQVFMTLKNEPSFFTDKKWARGLEWYERLFDEADGALVRGEVSPGYSKFPQWHHVPERIASVLPDVKLLYIVRHPVRRMQSHYHHRFVAGNEREPIERALRESPNYLDTSRYAMQLDRYLRFFPREQILVVVSEQLRHQRPATLRRVFEFVGVDADWWSPGLEGEENVSANRRKRRPLVRRIMAHPAAMRGARRVPPGLKDALRSASHRPPPKPDLTMSPALELELEEALREDVRRLRTYLPADFDGWGIA